MIGLRALVVDASVAVSIILKEPEAEEAALLVARCTSSGGQVFVPGHFWLEVVNALLRRQKWDGARVLQAIHALDDLQFEAVELDRASIVLTIDLGERHGLTAYDAGYLALAESINADLATFDAALRSAAGARAIHIGPARLAEATTPYEHEVTWPAYKGASAFLAKLRAEAVRPG
jgi:predicted nucleic acid-binding protein